MVYALWVGELLDCCFVRAIFFLRAEKIEFLRIEADYNIEFCFIFAMKIKENWFREKKDYETLKWVAQDGKIVVDF